jgi:stage II sporulation protein D
VDLEVLERGPSGRAIALAVETDAARFTVGRQEIRQALGRPGGGGLWSTAFTLDLQRRDGRITRVTAEGRGWGHGVGMCQWGAMQLSREGYDLRSILDHYYPGATLETWYTAATRAE